MRAGVTWATLQNLSPIEPEPRAVVCPDAILAESPGRVRGGRLGACGVRCDHLHLRVRRGHRLTVVC